MRIYQRIGEKNGREGGAKLGHYEPGHLKKRPGTSGLVIFGISIKLLYI